VATGTRPRGVGVPVVCVGGAVVDRKYLLAAPARPGTSNPAAAMPADGGVARNVAENLARLGIAVRLVSAVGDDEGGRGLLAGLAAAGVDTTAVAVVAGEGTAEYVAVLTPDGDLELGVAAMAVLGRIDAGQVDAAWPASGWVFADANLGPDVLRHVLALGRAAGGRVRVALDAVSVPKAARLPGRLDGVDLLFCNADEARALLAGTADTRQDDAAELAGALVAAGAAAVVLTRGPQGALLAHDGQVLPVPAVPADVVDVTGAGDALVAGTLAGLATGLTPAAAVARGTLVAALTVADRRTVRADLAAALAAAGAGRSDPDPDPEPPDTQSHGRWTR